MQTTILILAFAIRGFLLDPLSTEDLEPSSTPVFLEEPRDAYVVRNKPATLSCKAQHALQVYFECNGRRAHNRQHSQVKYINQITDLRQVEVSVDVFRSDVDMNLRGGTYGCVCYALSSTGTIRSRRAVVSVASSPAGAFDIGCLARYRACQEALQSSEYIQTLDEFCSKAKPVAACYAATSKECNDGSQETFEDLEALVDDVCIPHSTLIEDLNTEIECVRRNIRNFRTCSLTEEPPNNMGELCGIFEGYFKCYSEKVKEVCSSATALERLMKPFKKLLTSCSSERGVTFDYCTKHYVKCGLQTLDKGYELECMDLQELGECMLRTHCSPLGEMTPVLQSYTKQIPDYCNSESPFRKNFDKSYQCFAPTFKSVSATCVQTLRVKGQEMAESGMTDAKEEFPVENLRLAQEMLNCIVAKAGSPCGKEAEFSVKFLLRPFEDFLDQKCLELTQEKCSGATSHTLASGQMCGSWLLLLSAMFLLIRYFE